MGLFLMDSGDYARAAETLNEVLAINSRLRGPRHAYVGNDLENLGRLALRQRQYRSALERFQQALSIYTEKLPPSHGWIAAVWTMIGRAHLGREDAAAAERAFTNALNVWRMEYGAESIGYALAEALRARAWMMQGRYDDAEAALTRAAFRGRARPKDDRVRGWRPSRRTTNPDRPARPGRVRQSWPAGRLAALEGLRGA